MQENFTKKLEFDKIISMLNEQCSSTLGVELARKIHPETNLAKVKKMLAETTEAVTLIRLKNTPDLSGIKDISVALDKAKKGGILDPNMLLNISLDLNTSANLKKYFKSSENLSLSSHERDNSDMPILDAIFSDLYTNENLEKRISSSIQYGGIVVDTASDALYQIRKKIRDLEARIKEKINSVLHSSTYAKYLQETIVSVRNNRYVIPVKQEYRGKVPGLVHDTSASGSTLFIEPMFAVDLNNEIREQESKEQQEIERILSELTAIVAGCIPQLEHLTYNLGKLDFIFAKAKLSNLMKANEPKINKAGYINLKKARHPLIPVETVVPINLWCGKEFTTLVITGPNTGGKTVTLKTVGLLTVMAESGLHIPAEFDSTINVFDEIFVDIGDEQSIEQNLSTFSSHMVNIVNILKNMKDNSLVLLDELGSGTDPVEGSALAMAILELLHSKPIITMATTHYSEIKQFALQTAGIENASCEFNVKTLKPTYNLLIGVPGKSNAFAISKRLGLDNEILDRARTFIDEDTSRFEDIISVAEHNKRKTQKYLEQAEKSKTEIANLKKELEEEKYKLELKKNEILSKAKHEAAQILEDAKSDAKETLKEIRALAQEKDLSTLDKKAEKIKKKLKGSSNNIDIKPITTDKNYELHLGQSVKVLNLDKEGTVVTLPDSKNNLQVQVGIIKLTVQKNQLVPIEHKEVLNNKTHIPSNVHINTRSFSPEISVRGQTLDEAIMNIDKYLDDAILFHVKAITIVHGKGTGTLRTGIHKYLKSHPSVESYRLGTYGEGDTGVTIVTLK